MHSRDNCIFCLIVAGRAPAAVVYEDDVVLSFLDLFPASPGHTLVIIKSHCDDLFEASSGALEAVVRASRRVALALRSELQPAGLVVAQLNGAAAGQTVFHYHMHLVPRRDGDPLLLHGRQRADESALADLAAKLRARLAEIG